MISLQVKKGIGISIVKHVALKHNGSVHVETVEGKGSTFFLSCQLMIVVNS